MRADIDPEFEAQLTRSLHVLHTDPRPAPWPSPLTRVQSVVRHQNRVRMSVGAAALAVAITAGVVGVGVATSADPRPVVPGASTPPTAAPSTAAALSFLPEQTAPPSIGAGVRPGATSARPASTQTTSGDLPPEAAAMPAAALTRMRAIAAHLETVWGDLAPTRVEVVYAKDGRALSGTAGDPSAAKAPAYAIEMQGHFTCRSCGALRAETAGVIFETYDADFNLRMETLGGNTWGDLAKFGNAITLPPVDPTATPRPLGSTLARPLQGRAPANLATAEQVALQQAVDPTTAKVIWSEEVTYAQLRQENPRQFVKQRYAGTDNAKLLAVAVDGLIRNQQETSTRYAEIYWITGPYAGGSYSCGQDLCGLKAPTR
ncbi:MAG: hypothetical protein QOJ11_4263 [Frankiales bacterium]|jgi:hypothetical protein|nr:hypothetical protein [Frankiales bacterium]